MGLPSILSFFRNEFNKFNNTGAGMLDSIHHMTLKVRKNHILGLILSSFKQRHNGLLWLRWNGSFLKEK